MMPEDSLETEIPSTKTGKYQIEFHHMTHALTREYASADKVHDRVAELEADEEVLTLEVSAVPVPSVGA